MKKHLGIIVVLTISAVLFASVYLIQNAAESTRIAEGLRLARIAIDVDAVSNVNDRIGDGAIHAELLSDPPYQQLVSVLNKLAKAFPIEAKWCYIAAPHANQDLSRLVVLTVKYEEGNAITSPGYAYDISPYPAMKDAVYSDKELVVSSVVYDKTYKILTRSGFIKLYDDSGKIVGVLGVDLETTVLIRKIVSTLLATLAFISLVLLVWLWLVPGYRLTARQREIIATLEEKHK